MNLLHGIQRHLAKVRDLEMQAQWGIDFGYPEPRVVEWLNERIEEYHRRWEDYYKRHEEQVRLYYGQNIHQMLKALCAKPTEHAPGCECATL